MLNTPSMNHSMSHVPTMHTRYALLSVSDKTGIVDFARQLIAKGYGILSTGGTAALLKSSDVAVTEVADYIGFPEILDGRVKTLNPKIHAGILAQRANPEHQATMAQVNLYPFKQTVANPDCTFIDAIENIDIGGPTMVRAAAKNHHDVWVVVNPQDYAMCAHYLDHDDPDAQSHTRQYLASKAFAHTADYDAAIHQYLQQYARHPQEVADNTTNAAYPPVLYQHWQKKQDLRYGENPHQTAALYVNDNANPSLARHTLVQGKPLSFNNLADADAAWQAVKSFDTLACVIVKHANPCGVALADSPLHAYTKAFQTDPTSAFGGIIAFNQMIDEACAQALLKQFVEVLIAPGYTDGALRLLAEKPNIRVLSIAPTSTEKQPQRYEIKPIDGGILYQTCDDYRIQLADMRVVTHKQPTDKQLQDMKFAFQVAKCVKSNAIVFCRDGMSLGIGAGQMSRLDSAKIASIKAEIAGLDLQHSAVASDAFFPFIDGLDVVADAGATCIIQPGGSIRDDEVIARANARGLVMVFTGIRHFKH